MHSINTSLFFPKGIGSPGPEGLFKALPSESHQGGKAMSRSVGVQGVRHSVVLVSRYGARVSYFCITY